MMNKKEIFKKVGGILAELKEQYEYLSESPDNLNDLELELFSANSKFLSDHLSILVKLNQGDKKAADSVVQSEPGEKEAAPKDVKEVQVASDWKFELEKEPGLTFEFEEKSTDKLFDRPLTDEEKKVIDEKTRLKPGESNGQDGDLETAEEVEKEAVQAVESEEQVEEEAPEKVEDNGGEVELEESADANSDVFVKEVIITERTIAVPAETKPEESQKQTQTVNDILSRNFTQQSTLGSQFNTAQSRDLKGMISLNDKLLFVRDLFNGYSLAYSEALELLNRFDSFEAADNFLKQNYASKNNWADKQDVTDKFYEILNRRFSR